MDPSSLIPVQLYLQIITSRSRLKALMVWLGLGGSITFDARTLLNPYNTMNIYTFARGGDGAIWYNALNSASNKGTWNKIGGISPDSRSSKKGNPIPAVGADGTAHTFVRGIDGALWDNVYDNWYSLGGSITSDPSTIRDENGRLA